MAHFKGRLLVGALLATLAFEGATSDPCADLYKIDTQLSDVLDRYESARDSGNMALARSTYRLVDSSARFQTDVIDHATDCDNATNELDADVMARQYIDGMRNGEIPIDRSSLAIADSFVRDLAKIVSEDHWQDPHLGGLQADVLRFYQLLHIAPGSLNYDGNEFDVGT